MTTPGPTDHLMLSAMGRVLSQIAESTIEIAPALDEIAAEARTLCDADGAFCFVRVGELLVPSGKAGISGEFWESLQADPLAIDDASVVGRAVMTGIAAQVPDVTLDPTYHRPQTVAIGHYRAVMAVPFRSEGEIIGGFALARDKPRPFSDAQIAIASLFADHAAIAIRIGRLLAAGREAQDRERSLGQVLASVARASFDLASVLQTITEESARLCGADTGNIAILDGDVYRIVAFTGFPDAYREMVRGRIYPAERGSVVGRTLLERAVVQIADVLADPDYALRELQRIGGYRSVLGVPIWHEGRLIGVIATGRSEVRPFTDAEVRLLETFADQVAIALTVARLLTETTEALKRESAVGHVLASITRSTFDLQHILDTVVESAAQLSSADTANLVRGEDGDFRIVAAYGAGQKELARAFESTQFVPDRGSLVGRTLLERRTVHITDVLADPDYTRHDMQAVGGFRTALGVPLLRDGAPIGVLAVHRMEVRPFSTQEISLITTFADQAALAIANVALYQTIERQRTELARFAPQVAGLLSSPDGEALLAGHRREISALFCDLRGFTAFAEVAEPEELFSVLREYHAAVGEISMRNGGTVEHFAGDGLMIFFNDPTSLPEHQLAAVRTACQMREQFGPLSAAWRKRGYELGLGIGIAAGYATLGRIGFEGRYDYAAIGNSVILASRLSSAATAGQILISQRIFAAVDDAVEAEPVEGLQLKGFRDVMTAYAVISLRDAQG